MGEPTEREVQLIHNHDADCPGCDATIARLEGELAVMRAECSTHNDVVLRINNEARGTERDRDALRTELAQVQARVDEAAKIAFDDLNVGFNYDAESLERILAILRPTPTGTDEREER